MSKIDARATRDFTLEEVPYAKGDPISLAKNQFDDLGPEGAGLVERHKPTEAPIAKTDATGKSTDKVG